MVEFLQSLTAIDFLHYIFATIAIKALTIGSEFSFYWLVKDKDQYLNWYFNRETYNNKVKRG